MAYSAAAVANEFLELARRDGKELTPMQVQKLVYFAYGWYLAIYGKRLINERVEAWKWGPVVPSLYSWFRHYGSEAIKGMILQSDPRNPLRFVAPRVKSDDPIEDAQATQLIRRVWEIYGKYSAYQLSSMTHEPDSPWSLTPDKETRGTDIDDTLIANYFRRLALKHEQHTAR